MQCHNCTFAAFGCISMTWDGGWWLNHLTNVALWQCQPHQSFCTKIISLKIALRNNSFIKIRLRTEAYVNKKHWLTQSAWLNLEHEVLCDSCSRAMASHLHIPISSKMTQHCKQHPALLGLVSFNFAFCGYSERRELTNIAPKLILLIHIK